MKIWMSCNNTERKSKLSLFGSLFALFLLDFILLVPLIMFCYNSKIAMLLGLIVITIITMVGAIRIGTSRTRDNLLFLRDDNMSLFVVDISKFVRFRRGLLGFYFMESDKERILNSAIAEKKFETYLALESSLHGLETEIEGIESMKVKKDGISIVCRVIYPNHNKGRVSYFVKNGYEDEESLLLDLERRMLPSYDERILNKNHIGQLVLSGILLLANISLCVMSHPILGIIDVAYYFYFLGAFLPIVCYFSYVVITIKRGL